MMTSLLYLPNLMILLFMLSEEVGIEWNNPGFPSIRCSVLNKMAASPFSQVLLVNPMQKYIIIDSIQ